MKLVLLITLTLHLLSQTHINVIVRPSEGSMRTFEYKFIESVFSIYNKRNSDKLIINHIVKNEFNDITPELIKHDVNTSFAMSGYTIYDNDEFDFSQPYFIVKNSVITKEESSFLLNEKTYKKIGYRPVSTYKSNMDSLKKWFKVIPIPYEKYTDMDDDVKKGVIDGYIGDSIDGWTDPKLKVIFDINYNTSYIGLKFNKGSTLKKKLDPVINYYVKSKSYYTLLRKFFGVRFSEYYNHTSNAGK